MSSDTDSLEEHVFIPAKTLEEIRGELSAILKVLDKVAVLRVDVMRLRRVIDELDPDKTPIHPVTIDPEKAYRTSTASTGSLLTGPRFAPKKDK